MNTACKKYDFSARSGQTVVEFALVSILFVFMLVVTFNGIIAFGTQQYFSYVAFMGARAFQAGGLDRNAQNRAAVESLSAYIPGFNPNSVNQRLGGQGLKISFPTFGERAIAFVTRVSVPPGQDGDYSSVVGLDRDANNQPQNQNLEGSLPVAIQIEFRVPFATLPLGAEVTERIGFINMYAQSFLGRQVSQRECRSFFNGFLRHYSVAPGTASFTNTYSPYMEDNGC